MLHDSCEVFSDQLPIATRLDLTIADAEPPRPYRWKNANREVMEEKFNELTKKLELEREWLNSEVTGIVTYAVIQYIEAGVPRADITSWSKSGFTPACKEACGRVQRLRRMWQDRMRATAPDHAKLAARQRSGEALERKEKLIEWLLSKTHMNKVEESHGNMNKVWKLAKWTKSRGSSYRASDSYNYPPAVELAELTDREVGYAIRDVSAKNRLETTRLLTALLFTSRNLVFSNYNSPQTLPSLPGPLNTFRCIPSDQSRYLSGNQARAGFNSYEPITPLDTISKAHEPVLTNRIS